jgi:hypothetical protein
MWFFIKQFESSRGNLGGVDANAAILPGNRRNSHDFRDSLK